MAEKIDVEEMRATFQRVATYREVCNAVRAGASHTLFNGLLFLGLTALIYNLAGADTFLYLYAAIGVGELLVGLWKKYRPSPEGVLADSLLQFSFAALIAGRQVLLVQAGGKPQTISLLFAAWILFDAVRTFQQYVALRRMFTERPTAEHIAFVDDLVHEIRLAVPDEDPQALDLQTRPALKAKLLGDLAILVETYGGGVTAVSRKDFEIVREEAGPDRPPTGLLRIEGQGQARFELSAANWSNYARWKAEGGEPPPPVKVRPVRERPTDD
jgi:hypothetical protein